MPPSGFNQTAINGLLQFVEANYQSTMDTYRACNLPEDKALEKAAGDLEKSVEDVLAAFPDMSKDGLRGLTTFMTECYRDLISEIHAGQDKYNRPVVNGHAIEKELNQIRTYLTEFRL